MSDQEFSNITQYEIVANRRTETNSMLWQTPVLSLTAQAFLFTIALNKEAGRPAQVVSAGLALITSIASVQLMMKHRYQEVEDAKWLEKFERSNASQGFTVLHVRTTPPKGSGIRTRILSVSSYKVWLFTLAVFGVAALLVLLLPKSFNP